MADPKDYLCWNFDFYNEERHVSKLKECYLNDAYNKEDVCRAYLDTGVEDAEFDKKCGIDRSLGFAMMLTGVTLVGGAPITNATVSQTATVTKVTLPAEEQLEIATQEKREAAPDTCDVIPWRRQLNLSSETRRQREKEQNLERNFAKKCRALTEHCPRVCEQPGTGRRSHDKIHKLSDLCNERKFCS